MSNTEETNPLAAPGWHAKPSRTGGWLRRAVELARGLHERERARARAEISSIPGLMALLMKPRNGQRWNAAERVLIKKQLQGLGVVGLYLVLMAIPGTSLTLPLFAWWLDRRRCRRIVMVNGSGPRQPTTFPAR